ncbi:MAG: RluA family pseudouridine synthase [Treponema sp.]|jgi:23S rRNA pseudouridine955/2504/2580 synthase|nr:RluA family pseudouridine synthase [Treponema sp.]
MKNFNMTIGKDDHDRRVDRIIRKAFTDFPLSFIHRLFRKKQVLVNNVPAKIDSRVHEGDILSIKGNIQMPEQHIKPESPISSGKLEILHEGSGLLILNKPAGIDVHGEKSLETLVQDYLKDKLPPSLSFKPGPLHRLDKPTSGIIAFSTSLEAARRFSDALQSRNIKKYYLALMDGVIEQDEVWEDLLYRDQYAQKTILSNDEGQTAIMKVHPLCTSLDDSAYTLAFIELETGRTHQIRAQGSLHQHPLAGDKKYGGSFLQGGFFLHAWQLSLPSEIAADLPALMIAPLPDEKKSILTSIFGDKMQKLYQKIPRESLLDGII